jgi:hypothetical protein
MPRIAQHLCGVDRENAGVPSQHSYVGLYGIAADARSITRINAHTSL